MSDSGEYEPKILGFLCNWCSYAGADLAGVSRLQYPSNIRSIRTMCSARVDPIMIIEAFAAGMDGVIVLGCHLGDCHYTTGNYYTQSRMKMMGMFLEIIGINPQRLYLDWVSSAEGERFAILVTEFTTKIKELGRLDKEEGINRDELRKRLFAARAALASEKLRWLVGVELTLVSQGNVFGDKISQERFDKIVHDSILNEFARERIALSIRETPLSVKEIAGQIGLPAKEVLKHIAFMENKGEAAMVGVEGVYPKYKGVSGEGRN